MVQQNATVMWISKTKIFQHWNFNYVRNILYNLGWLLNTICILLRNCCQRRKVQLAFHLCTSESAYYETTSTICILATTDCGTIGDYDSVNQQLKDAIVVHPVVQVILSRKYVIDYTLEWCLCTILLYVTLLC